MAVECTLYLARPPRQAMNRADSRETIRGILVIEIFVKCGYLISLFTVIFIKCDMMSF